MIEKKHLDTSYLISKTTNIFDIEDEACADYVARFKSSKKFIAAFRKSYDFLLAYHGTNIDENEALVIKSHGLKIASIEMLTSKAGMRFIKETDDEMLKEKILNSISEFYSTKDHITVGEINFTLDKDPLQGEAYQYLLFGPESMLPLADSLNKDFNINFRRRMADFGIPTIVKVHVPLTDIKNCWLEGIFEYINHGWVESCVVIRANVPPVNVLALERVERPCDKYGFLGI
ncbi:hypothetical protein [Pedobacter gandavensis]|uniref:hypothetical protein n=1 Tax=Pedobacter gandavensis TaxID=2679963 RepID=UPI00292E2F9B|nr:hypothetical protein [Pedobacter gandavensis]